MFRTIGQVPTRYSPVRHSWPKPRVRLACVRHAASVRSEPGSNSQVHLPHPSIPAEREISTKGSSPTSTLHEPGCFRTRIQDAPGKAPTSSKTFRSQTTPRPPAHPFLTSYPTMSNSTRNRRNYLPGRVNTAQPATPPSQQRDPAYTLAVKNLSNAFGKPSTSFSAGLSAGPRMPATPWG